MSRPSFDPSSPLYAELPVGGAALPPVRFSGLIAIRSGAAAFRHCAACGGFVEGDAAEFRLDFWAIDPDRRGVSLRCRRCGAELGFDWGIS